MSVLVSLDHLSRRFANFTAVNALSLEEARATLGAARFAAVVVESRAMPLEQIVNLAAEASAGLAIAH